MMDIWAIDIARYLGGTLYGANIKIAMPCSINNISPGGLLFAKKYSEEILSTLNNSKDCMVLACPEYLDRLDCSHLISGNPRLDFARVVQKYFTVTPTPIIAATAQIGNDVILGSDVTIGEYCVVGNNVRVGNCTEIRHHVVLADKVMIGNNCLIKSHTVIGEEGYGFERDDERVPIRIPHLGSVRIGDHVEIGALTVIARGTLDDTIIENNVKIDDHVFVAHNVTIGRNSMIIAGAEISGSSRIGKNCWLGPNCCIMNGITIGDDCYIGLGGVVTKSLPDNVVVAGSPARILRKNRMPLY